MREIKSLRVCLEYYKHHIFAIAYISIHHLLIDRISFETNGFIFLLTFRFLVVATRFLHTHTHTQTHSQIGGCFMLPH